MIEIKVRKGEPVDKALRRLKESKDMDFVLKKVRSKRYYEKPSAKRKRRMAKAKFEAKLAARRDKFRS